MELDTEDEVIYLLCSRVGKGFFQSWKKFWLHHTGNNWPIRCQISGCEYQATFGGQVRVLGHPGIFILPSCWDCYEENEWLGTKNSAVVAWAKVRMEY